MCDGNAAYVKLRCSADAPSASPPEDPPGHDGAIAEPGAEPVDGAGEGPIPL